MSSEGGGIRVIWWDEDGTHALPIEEYEAEFGTLGLLRERKQRMDTPEQVQNQPVMGPPNPLRPKGLTVGRNVHYVNSVGLHLAAIVTNVQDREAGIVRLAVFDYWSEDMAFFDDVPHDPSGQQMGSWHYIEHAE